MVQASSTGLAGTWKNASMWFGTKEEAVDLAKQMLKEATAASRRASIVVVSSFSGETS